MILIVLPFATRVPAGGDCPTTTIAPLPDGVFVGDITRPSSPTLSEATGSGSPMSDGTINVFGRGLDGGNVVVVPPNHTIPSSKPTPRTVTAAAARSHLLTPDRLWSGVGFSTVATSDSSLKFDW